MLQECHKKYWESDRTDLIESVKRLLRRKKKESEQRGDTAIYIHLLFRLLSAETAREVLEAIVEIMPQAVVTGMTETIFVNEDMESMLRMNFTFFSHGSVKLMEYLGPSECYEEAGKTIAEKISRMPQVKAVGIYSAGPSTDFHKFVSCVSGANEEIPFFGATAGTFEFSADDRNRFRNLFFLDKYSDAEQYVVGTKVYYQGILLVLFSGEDLHVKVDYIFGWKPLGKEMTITGTCGHNCISRIDNMRPTEIFRRYLKVNPDENFVYNIYEFPLAIERNGCVMGRVAPRYDHEGRIYFSSDVYEGEKVRLTYAVHDNLIQVLQQREILHVRGRAVVERLPVQPQAVAQLAVDDDAADCGTVSVDVLGRRMNYDVGSKVKRVHKIGRRCRAVDNKRNASPMSLVRDAL